MSNLILSEIDFIFYISINRPDVRNAFDSELIHDLTDVFVSLQDRQDIRAVVLSGQGKAFCAGADLEWMRGMIHYSKDENLEDASRLWEMFHSLSILKIPVIGKVHGAAFGGALGLIACCDYVIATRSTQFCFSEVKLGIVPAVISPFVLNKCLLGAIKPFLTLGIPFTTAQALNFGLIHDIVETEAELEVQTQKIIKNIAASGPEAVREAKKLVETVCSLKFSEIKRFTIDMIVDRRLSKEGQEGMLSFLEGRKPQW